MTKTTQTSVGFLVIVSLVVSGCVTSQKTTLEERNKELVRRMNEEVWNKGNLETLDEFFAPDVVRHFLPNASVTKGLDQLRIQMRRHRKAFPDWGEDIRLMIAEGNLVAIYFESTGTNDGSFLGNPPTGKQIHISEMSIFRIVDGKVAEQWLIPDMLGLIGQLDFTAQSNCRSSGPVSGKQPGTASTVNVALPASGR